MISRDKIIIDPTISVVAARDLRTHPPCIMFNRGRYSNASARAPGRSRSIPGAMRRGSARLSPVLFGGIAHTGAWNAGEMIKISNPTSADTAAPPPGDSAVFPRFSPGPRSSSPASASYDTPVLKAATAPRPSASALGRDRPGRRTCAPPPGACPQCMKYRPCNRTAASEITSLISIPVLCR
jgi:hypothetical protein